MIRKLLGVVIAMVLPSLLAGQAPAAPAPATPRLAPAHAVATQVQGDVAMADELDGMNNEEGVDEADGQNNDVDDHDVDQDEQEGENEDGDIAPPPPPATGQLRQIGRHRP